MMYKFCYEIGRKRMGNNLYGGRNIDWKILFINNTTVKC